MYVGQTVDIERRDWKHLNETNPIPFDKFLRRTGRNNFTIEIVASVVDVSRGSLANALENIAMDEFRTFFPESRCGYNFTRANVFGDFTTEMHEAKRAAQIAARSSIEWKTEKSKTMKEIWGRPDFKRKMLAYRASPESRAKKSKAAIAKWKDPDYRKAAVAAMVIARNTPEAKTTYSQASKTKWNNPEYARKTIKALKLSFIEKGPLIENGQSKGRCTRWNINRGKPCVCGKHAGLKKKDGDQFKTDIAA